MVLRGAEVLLEREDVVLDAVALVLGGEELEADEPPELLVAGPEALRHAPLADPAHELETLVDVHDLERGPLGGEQLLDGIEQTHGMS